MEISNQKLALMLVAAIVISLGGTIISLVRLDQMAYTGLASGQASGRTNLTINGSVMITFIIDNVDFGLGYANNTGGGTQYCTIETNGTKSADCVGFQVPSSPFIIRNDGNANVSLQLASDKDAAGFLGGTAPVFQYFMQNNETGSCASGLAPATFTDVNVTAPGTTVCPDPAQFTWTDTNDTVRVHIKVDIPEDAVTGAHNATLTATGTG